MIIMKKVCASFIIFQTLMAHYNAQMRPPNWDQRRFGPRTNFFGQDGGNEGEPGRRNFFGNDFQPGEMFPRRSPGGDDARRQVPPQVPPPMGPNPEPAGPVGGMGQIPPPMGQNPEPAGPVGGMGQNPVQMGPIGGAGPENNGQGPPMPQTPPPMGQIPDQMGPIGGTGQTETPFLQSPELGPGTEPDPLGPGQEEVAAPQPPPPGQMGGAGDEASFAGFGPQSPTVEPTPLMPDPTEFQDRGMGQPPSPGQTELLSPGQSPMPQIPNPVGRGGEGLPPVSQGPPPQPGMATGGAEVPVPQPPIPETAGVVPEQGMRPPGGGFGDQGMMGGSQPPEMQGGELGRQRRPLGFSSRPGGQGMGARPVSTFNRPPRFQMSK